MRYAIMKDGRLEIVDPRKIIDQNETRHPCNILKLWSEADLNAIGIYEITDGTFDSFEFKKTGEQVDLIGNKVVETILTEPISIIEIKAREMGNVYAEYEEAMEALKNGYTNSERETWRKQEEEARAYTADNTSPTPFINGLIAAGVAGDVPTIAAKIIAKADALVVAASTPTGIKQRKEDALNAIDDITGTIQEVRDAIQ
jgi:hypothetical protein